MYLLPCQDKLDKFRTLWKEVAEVYTMANVMDNVLRRGIIIDYVNIPRKRGFK